MKKTPLVLSLVVLLLVTSLPAAYAAPKVVRAPFSDIDLAEFVEEFAILGSLGIYAGYPDGTVRPANLITRAEYAAVMVRMLDKSRLAGALDNIRPGFGDTIPSWAWSWVNAAYSLGVVQGYPDGTFRPDENVTFAEAVTMLVNALGYRVTGGWPAAHIARAIDLGVVDDKLVLFHNMYITRDDMARLTVNAMRASPPDSHNRPDESRRSLLHRRQVEGTVLNIDEKGMTIRVEVDGRGVTYRLADRVSLHGASHLDTIEGAEVVLLGDQDGRVTFICMVDAAPMRLSGVLDQWLPRSMRMKISGVLHDVDDEARIYLNSALQGQSAKEFPFETGDIVTVHLDSDWRITRIELLRTTWENAPLTDMSLARGERDYGTITVGADTVINVDADTEVILNGFRSDLARVEAAFREFRAEYAGEPPALVTVRTYGNHMTGSVEALSVSVITDNVMQGAVTSTGRDRDGDYVRIRRENGTVMRVYYSGIARPGGNVVLLLGSDNIAYVLLAEISPQDTPFYAKLISYEIGLDRSFAILELSDGTELTYTFDPTLLPVITSDAIDQILYVKPKAGGKLDAGTGLASDRVPHAESAVVLTVTNTYIRLDTTGDGIGDITLPLASSCFAHCGAIM